MSTSTITLLLSLVTTVVAYATLKLGVVIGRHQEYLKRSEPLLLALKSLADGTVSDDPRKRLALSAINALATAAFKKYHPDPED